MLDFNSRWFWFQGGVVHSEWRRNFPLPSPDVSRSRRTWRPVTDESIARSEEVKGGQGLRESASLLCFRGVFMENKSEMSVYLLISSKCELFLTKAAWIWPQLGFVGMIKEAKEEFFLQTLFYTRTADFQYDTPVTAKCTVLLTYALSLISSFYWVAACSRLRIGNTAELWPVSSQTPTICMRSGDSSSEKVDRPPRYEPICHWRGSIYRLGVRSEETDKGSESGRRRLIDWRQIHPLSASLPLHESVKPPLSCT